MLPAGGWRRATDIIAVRNSSNDGVRFADWPPSRPLAAKPSSCPTFRKLVAEGSIAGWKMRLRTPCWSSKIRPSFKLLRFDWRRGPLRLPHAFRAADKNGDRGDQNDGTACAVNHLCKVIQKCTGLKQAHFNKALREKLNEGGGVNWCRTPGRAAGALRLHQKQSLAGACRTQHMLQESFDLTKSTRHRRRYRILTALWVGITYAKKECPYLPMLVFCSPLKELR